MGNKGCYVINGLWLYCIPFSSLSSSVVSERSVSSDCIVLPGKGADTESSRLISACVESSSSKWLFRSAGAIRSDESPCLDQKKKTYCPCIIF